MKITITKIPAENTPISEMDFPQAWRLIRSVEKYNLGKDKHSRFSTVEDLIGYPIIDFLGVGKMTTQYFHEFIS